MRDSITHKKKKNEGLHCVYNGPSQLPCHNCNTQQPKPCKLQNQNQTYKKYNYFCLLYIYVYNSFLFPILKIICFREYFISSHLGVHAFCLFSQ